MSTPDYYKKTVLAEVTATIKASGSAETTLAEANAAYDKDDTDSRFRVACKYLAAARFMRSRSPSEASRVFHFAGHHLRKLEEWRNAGNAYVEAGDSAMQASTQLPETSGSLDDAVWAARSYARAKMCYVDVGDAEEAAEAYTKEQNARTRVAWLRGQRINHSALLLLRLTSNYGQSFRRWAMTAAVAILLFAIGWETEHSLGHLTGDEPWTVGVSGLCMSVMTIATGGYGVSFSSPWSSQVLLVTEVLVGYFLLGVGVAIVARRVRER